MLAPMPPQQRFLERARVWLVSLRRLLSTPGWNTDLARQIERGLTTIADYARNRRLDEVQAAMHGLSQDWERLRVVELPPDDAARALLRNHAQQVFKAVAAVGAADDDALGLPVYAFLPDGAPSMIVLQTFRAQGLQLTVFHDGDALAQALSERRPEAFMVETGYAQALSELLDRLSPKNPGIGQLPIVALASADDAHPRLNAALAGADLYAEAMEDPLLAARLRHLLADYVRDPYRVLIIDDDHATGLLSQAVLERAGFQVQLAEDAEAARSALQRSLPDLVLMDLELPGESGLALTASLRDSRGALVLPIVFLSGEGGEDVRFQALRAGGDDYLVKPVRPRHLISMARSRVKRARALTRQLRARATEARGHLRRGAFLDQLRRALLTPSADPVALIIVCVDAAAGDLPARLGVVRTHDLERAIGERIDRCLMPADVYCQLDEFEFAVLVERPNGGELVDLAEGLVRALGNEDFHDAGQRLALTASAGIARRPQQQIDLEAWLQQAITALRAARAAGGDRVEGRVDRLEHALPADREIRIRALLKTAAAADWRIDYRPLVPLHSEQVHRYLVDVQLRDHMALLGGVGRAEYFGPARALGLVEALDRASVAAQIALLRDYVEHGQAIDLSLSVDATSLSHLRHELEALPDAARGVHLALEVDVDSAFEQDDLLRRFCSQRLACVSLGVYDGTGRFGHWPMLQALPIERLRIPASALVAVNPAARAMIATWRASGRSLTADGVVSPVQLSSLWSLGVDHVAGDGIAPASARPDWDFDAH